MSISFIHTIICRLICQTRSRILYYRPWCTTANWKRLVHLILGVFFSLIFLMLSHGWLRYGTRWWPWLHLMGRAVVAERFIRWVLWSRMKCWLVRSNVFYYDFGDINTCWCVLFRYLVPFIPQHTLPTYHAVCVRYLTNVRRWEVVLPLSVNPMSMCSLFHHTSSKFCSWWYFVFMSSQGGVISPESCLYMTQWLTMQGQDPNTDLF